MLNEMKCGITLKSLMIIIFRESTSCASDTKSKNEKQR